LTSSRQRPWQNFTATFVRANKAAGIANLHFHDLRGTAATRFYIAGLKVRTIGEILGWAEDDVEKIIRNQAAQ
jgi:integrase